MFAATESPLSLTPEELDNYLARGWFRMNQTIFTTHFLQFNNIFYSAVWLRVSLAGYQASSRHAAILKGIKNFRVEVKKAALTEEHEQLYEYYKSNLKFDTHTSLANLLYGGHSHNIYNTWQVNIYDAKKLIACGFFDMGKTSAEGIVSIYHPHYKKYSLGKCLIYAKIDHCVTQGLVYFYPGYVVPGYAAFDYKLGIGTERMQYYNIAEDNWVSYKDIPGMYQPLADMRVHLKMLQAELAEKGIPAELMHYLFFDARLNITFWKTLLDYPVFLQVDSTKKGNIAVTLVIYNIITRRYVLAECLPVYTINNAATNHYIFASDVLNIYREVFASAVPEEMAAFIEQYANSNVE